MTADNRAKTNTGTNRKTLPAIASIAAAILVCGWAAAHDFWIQPVNFLPKPGEAVPIRLFVGDHFQGEPFGRYASLIERFVVSGPKGETDTLGLEGAEPAGLVRFDAPGLYTVGYRSKPSFTALNGPAFDDYLSEEGLERISQRRVEAGLSDAPVREAFSRCAKALVQVGEPKPEDRFPTLGLTLELTPEANPYLLGRGESLPVRLTYRGNPLAGALVSAFTQDDPKSPQAIRTDQDGMATFKLDRPGLWMIRTVHMIQPPPDIDADWLSLWASLTFMKRR